MLKKSLLVAAFTGLLFTACKKEEVKNELSESSQVSSKNNNQAQLTYNLIDDAVSAEVINIEKDMNGDVKQKLTLIGTCPTINYTADNSEKPTYVATMTIDFGTACIQDGVTRKGKIIISKNGKFNATGTVTTVTLENYEVNGFKIEGTLTRTVKGFTGTWLSGTWEYDVKVENGKVTGPNNTYFTWESERNVSVNLPSFDISTTGEAEGVDLFGKPYTVTITTPLVIKRNCDYIVSGVLEVAPTGVEKRVVNYGSGTCDNNVTITVGDKVYNVTL
ncbi:MAG: hypothetical protein RLZZ414_1603 [Bacteroidota bacterium]|jgi:hypothetical protein